MRQTHYGFVLGSSVLCCLIDCASALHFWTMADIKQLQHSLMHPHIVDTSDFSVLMRVGNPAVYNLLDGPSISLPALKKSLNKTAGNFFPTRPYELVDVSLLNEPAEQDFIEIERRTFGDQFIHWPSHGMLLEDMENACSWLGLSCPNTMQPGEMSSHVRFHLGRTHQQWDPDHLEERVQTLHTLLYEKGPKPRVIFFHGISGCDRTGALFAAYALRYRNRSLTEAIAENELIARRHMSYKHQVATQWYCEYLVSQNLYFRGYDCGNCAPYQCSDGGEAWDIPGKKRVWIMALMFGIIALLPSALWRGAMRLLSATQGRVEKVGSCRSYRREPTTPLLSTCFDRLYADPFKTPPPMRQPASPPGLLSIWRRRRRPDEEYMLLVT